MEDLDLRSPRRALETLLRSRIWLFGVMLSLGAAFVQALAFTRAPIAVVQTAFGAGLVLLIVVSHLHWGEHFQRREAAGLGISVVALVCAGASISSGSSAIGSGSSQGLVTIVSVCTLITIAFIMFMPAIAGLGRGIEFGVASGLFYGISGIATKGIATIIRHRGLAASGPPILSSAYPYIFIVSAAAALITFQVGIQRGRLGIVAPLSNVLASAYVVVVGMLVFDERLPASTAPFVLRVGGIIGMLVGTAIVASGTDSETQARAAVPSA